MYRIYSIYGIYGNTLNMRHLDISPIYNRYSKYHINFVYMVFFANHSVASNTVPLQLVSESGGNVWTTSTEGSLDTPYRGQRSEYSVRSQSPLTSASSLYSFSTAGSDQSDCFTISCIRVWMYGNSAYNYVSIMAYNNIKMQTMNFAIYVAHSFQLCHM